MDSHAPGEQLDPNGLSWSVPCYDSVDAQHEAETAKVLVLGDRIALVLPPGETLVFTPEEAGEFAELLGTAAGDTTHA
ncbi:MULTISPECIES: hypothetical protein [Actinopolyspora]|uniref:Uncharacterized protein n=1 Tax=Actinopolyspora saharensis TaxID=995062 RepID=A0A1H1FCP6_9ACTN|nr:MULTISPECIES: hypothetical protein [Actinopolyspora]NHD19235.1 hypothetical protein [Actinopolyspora sp. BKK2]NHE78359.1 hypothetical protein [Actinopolyspora sp. BKK1]SDQ98732.1 hypothetical protein SAMN04489718_2969 [Actinopolyspora saharensis]